MVSRRVIITFPAGKAVQPLTYYLVKDFDLVINILFARISPDEEGTLVLEISNSQATNIEKGIDFLRGKGLVVENLAKAINWDEAECIHCGACTAVCRSRALSLDHSTWRLDFDQSKCIVCELCIQSCPLGIIKEAF